MISKKFIPIIAGAIAAGIIITVLVYINTNQNKTIDNENISIEPNQNITEIATTYKINTQCEIVYALARGKYPDGKNITPFDITYILNKYPDEFKEWKEILQDPEKKKIFATQGNVTKFNQLLIPILMKEYQINPNLTSTAMLMADPEPDLQKVYDENKCKEYFFKHDNGTKS